MTYKLQESINYPLIWTISSVNPDVTEPEYNTVHRRIKKMVRFTDWLRAHYETAYHSYLAEHLHEYGLGTDTVPNFVGLRVTGAKTLKIILYRKSWSEVYVDVIVRAFLDIYSGKTSVPERSRAFADYRIRGYYDLYAKRCRLFKCFMPYRPEDDMDMLRLDDYLVPNIARDELEDIALWFLKEHYPDGLIKPGHISIRSMIREMWLHAFKTGLSPNGKDKGALFLYGKRATLVQENGVPLFTEIPSKTILLDRNLSPYKAKYTASHECCHFGLHSLFFLFQENYIEELHEYFEPIEEAQLPLDEDDRKEISKMEWQANRLAPRVLMPYPIFFDQEEKSQFDTGKENCSAMIRAFCEVLEKNGYWVGLYTNRSTLDTHIDDDIETRYAIWAAEWGSNLNYSGSVGIWQFSSRGFVDGITGNVDLNAGYVDYPTLIKENGLNGFPKPVVVEEKAPVFEQAPPVPDVLYADVTVTVQIGKDSYKGTLVKE